MKSDLSLIRLHELVRVAQATQIVRSQAYDLLLA